MHSPTALEKPNKIELNIDQNELKMSVAWIGAPVLEGTAMAVSTNIILFVALLGDNFSDPLIASVGFFFLFALNICTTYYALAWWCNKTLVSADKEAISIVHKPFPWLGKRDISTKEIRQIYSQEIIRTSKYRRTLTYNVYVNYSNGETIKLISGLESSIQALFIVQELEKYLGIQNDDTVRRVRPNT